jgi:hypothetical protein
MNKMKFELFELNSGKYVVSFRKHIRLWVYSSARYVIKPPAYRPDDFGCYHIHNTRVGPTVYDDDHGEDTMLKALDLIIEYMDSGAEDEKSNEGKRIVKSCIKFNTLNDLRVFRNGLEKVQIKVNGFEE